MYLLFYVHPFLNAILTCGHIFTVTKYFFRGVQLEFRVRTGLLRSITLNRSRILLPVLLGTLLWKFGSNQ